MTLRIPRQLRAACAALALATYAVPLGMGLAAPLGHGAEHALEWLRDMERRAAAMGVAHLHDQPAERPDGTFVHAHGGAPHAHDAGVGALLAAAEESREPADEAAPTPVDLTSHLPAAAGLAVFASVERNVGASGPHAATPRTLLPPPLPPPRA